MVGSISQGMGSRVYYTLQQGEDALTGAENSGAVNKTSSAQSTVASQTQASGDTVTISEKARKLAEASTEASEEAPAEASKEEIAGDESESGTVSAMLESQNDDQGSGTDPVEQIKKQIKEVKKKLQDAQERLAQAQAKSGQSAPVEPEEDPSEAAMKAAMAALTGNAEVEAIQGEIKMLSQRLLMLNNQLREAMGKQGTSVPGATGTAGLGGASGRGGLGERIAVTA
jgi:hypothetical protein